MSKTTSKTAATESDELTVEQRLARLEKVAQQHGWDLGGGSPTDPDEPPAQD